MTDRLLLGAMSGTSADGVDVALTRITGRGLEMQATLLTHAYQPYSPELRKRILDTRQRGDVRLPDLAEMGRQVTLAYVDACKLALRQANVGADQVAAIAAHGQTLFHGPPNTIQYFDPSLLAYETGIAVVSDFRRADLAAGGQGAPLVPFADWILFRHPTKNRVLLNIGGIANITYLKAGGSIDDVIAFDTGPGNCISDWLMRERGGIDVHGLLAKSGKVHQGLLKRLRQNPFFQAKPPKSTDGPAMIALFNRALEEENQHLSLQEQLATAAAFTVSTIASAIPSSVDQLYVSGGGVRNATIMVRLHEAASANGAKVLPLQRIAEGGEASDAPFLGPRPRPMGPNLVDAREALAFALLGAATLDGEPSNVPSATGASRRVVLGSVTPKPF